MILQLKTILKRHGLTSLAFADMVGVSKTTVSYWLNGKVFPPADMIEKIAAALNIPVWHLFADPEQVLAESGDFVAYVRCNGKSYEALSLRDLEKVVDELKSGEIQY